MKSTSLLFAFALLLISCSKKDDTEPEITINPTNELVGTIWQRTLQSDVYNYLEFKTNKELEFSSNFKGELSVPLALPYTLNEKKLVYKGDGRNYTGTISGDTLTVIGNAGLLIYVKIK